MSKNGVIPYQSLKNSPDFEQYFEKHKEKTLLSLRQTADNFNKGTLTAIHNQIANSTIVDATTAILYFKIEGIHSILRTKAAIAHLLIYQGVPGILSPITQFTTYEGKEYISLSDLMAILSYSESTSQGTKEHYINYVLTFIRDFKDFKHVKNLRHNFRRNSTTRLNLKQKKIRAHKINRCQFTNKAFKNYSEVEFAHIDAIAYKPHLANDIRNGVIILKSIHHQLTKQQIYDFEGMYKFCERHNYNLDWSKHVDW